MIKKVLTISLVLICTSAFSQNGQIKTTSGTANNFYYKDGNVGIGTTTPQAKIEIKGTSGVYSDFANYEGTSLNSILPNGKMPSLIIDENLKGNLVSAVGGQVTYRGGLSFGLGGPGIYSVNPNPAGSPYYGEIRFHTTYWNGSNYSNADRMVIKINGNVGIGTITPGFKLDVQGTIRAQELKVDMQGADFVFEENYQLRSLEELENFVQENKHLPDVAPAKEMQENGVNQSEMNQKLLQKIEELTLYMIKMDKRMEFLENENLELKKKVHDSL
ncbi:hypothetical protein DF185_22810 [Marinifilum breve]|uniref:BZIP transcription factor n=1 Tax=Marinifilum breve TaxID=2184082 RepID=A0A2V3ZR03_9BACT|nr:hypothetical protein [Marinifilum breve]PXX95012.1 hypothetical protein DF185_22810 [Marinifilum breve]